MGECGHVLHVLEPYRIGGAVADADTDVDFSTITRSLEDLAIGDRPGSAPSCPRCDYVRISTDVVAVLRQTSEPLTALDDAAFSAAAPPFLPPTTRDVPYLKMRVATCRPVMRPVWIDTGQSIVVPWPDAAVAITAPAEGWRQVSPGDTITPPTPGEHTTWDVRLWVTLRCTSCCPDDCAVLTDSRMVGDLPVLSLIHI